MIGQILILVIMLIVLTAVFIVLFTSKKASTDFSYEKHERLCSPAERSFLGALELTLGEDYRILTKVRITDVLKPSGKLSKSQWRIAFNKISSKHLDYLVCSSDTLEFILAIELDDKSHSQAKTQHRDRIVETACQSARFPLARFKAKNSYSLDSINATIISVLKTYSK